MIRKAAGVVALMSLGACAVGPNFHTPPAPADTAYTSKPIVGTAAPSAPIAGGGQVFSAQTTLAPDWWRQFRSPALDTLVAEALARNSDLAAAKAALKAARETWLASRSVLLPTVDAGTNTSRTKSSQYLAPVPNQTVYEYSLQTAQVNVGYTLDLFGGNRRLVEQARAQYLAQSYETAAARLTLISNVVAAAITEGSLKAQIAAQQRIIGIERQQLEITRRQQRLGAIAGVAVLTQAAALAGAQAALPPLQKQLAQSQDALAYLTGHSPAEGAPVEVDLAGVTLPHDLPLTLPAQLVGQRPDVRVAEANLHAASAAVGVAIAARLPAITLGASVGGQAANWSSLLSAANGFWTVGAGLAQPIFAGGSLRHKQRAAEAGLDQARDLYRSAVLTAFQNVADTLHALQIDADGLAAAEAARQSAEASLTIARRQTADGAASFLNVLAGEQALRQAEQGAITAEAQRLVDTAALYQALGGGWQAGDAPANR